MLEPWLMGALALGILWVNVLLIAAAALMQRAELGRKLDEIARAKAAGGWVVGEVESDVLAERRTAQVGRAMTVAGPDRILFTDKATVASVLGGAVRDGGATRPILAATADVWFGPDVRAERAEALSFDDAWRGASTSRGVELDVVQRVGKGARVWIAGAVEGGAIRPTLVATSSPEAELARARRLLLAMALGAVVGGAVVTSIALVPPVFGTVSTIGGALGVAFFLLVQPAGVVARNAARTPDRKPVGGIWQR